MTSQYSSWKAASQLHKETLYKLNVLTPNYHIHKETLYKLNVITPNCFIKPYSSWTTTHAPHKALINPPGGVGAQAAAGTRGSRTPLAPPRAPARRPSALRWAPGASPNTKTKGHQRH